MRTIKFRAWEKPYKSANFGGKMHYGIEEQAFFHKWLQDKDYILLQFTGLKDKNGKDIFESDVLKVILPSGESYIGQVDFSYGQFWCVRHNGYGGEGYDFDFLCNKDRYVKQAELEVIGNIYENDIIKLNKENL